MSSCRAVLTASLWRTRGIIQTQNVDMETLYSLWPRRSALCEVRKLYSMSANLSNTRFSMDGVRKLPFLSWKNESD